MPVRVERNPFVRAVKEGIVQPVVEEVEDDSWIDGTTAQDTVEQDTNVVVDNKVSGSDSVQIRRTGGQPRDMRWGGTDDWGPTFITMLYKGASIAQAARSAGVSEPTPYRRRKEDETFRAAWMEAGIVRTALLKQEACRRAYHGTLKPIFYKGVKCGVERRYSDNLLMFLLKQRDPSFRDSGIQINNTSQTLNLFNDIQRDTQLIQEGTIDQLDECIDNTTIKAVENKQV
jgi:hypothetical protein